MNGSRPGDAKAIRLVFELARADNPRLFDELSQFSQGSKRVNRLRVLAYDGLLVQSGVFVPCVPVPDQSRESPASAIRGAHVTDQLFEPGLNQ
jgi:hypothetical protein